MKQFYHALHPNSVEILNLDFLQKIKEVSTWELDIEKLEDIDKLEDILLLHQLYQGKL